MVSRRTMIAGGAGAAVLAALGYRAWDRGAFSAGEGPAFEAWRDWQGRPGEGPTRPLHAAILAASAHNTQPWLFEPHEDFITVYADISRNLGAADPFRRELCFSLGCALENLSIAAFGQGFIAHIRLIEGGYLSPSLRSATLEVGKVVLYPLREAPDPVTGELSDALRKLYWAIPNRHTNRGLYLPDRLLPKSFRLSRLRADSLLPFLVAVADKGARQELGALIVEATERFIADPAMAIDSGRWFRTGRRAIGEHRDGVTSDTAGLSPALNTMAKLLPDQSSAAADKYWLAATKDVHVSTAQIFGIYFVRNRLNVIELIDAGMHWQRQHLMTTVAGLAVQPLNQPIEMMDRDLLLGRKNDYAKALRKIAKIEDGIPADPAFIFRVGYAEHPALPSPRRKLNDVIRQKGFA